MDNKDADLIQAALLIGFEWNEELNCYICKKEHIVLLCELIVDASLKQMKV